MDKLQLLAKPWWVNLLVLVPVFCFLFWRRRGLRFRWRQLVLLAAFAGAFGFVEAAVVVYLRAAVGLLPGHHGTLDEVRRFQATYEQQKSINNFPPSLLLVEVWREAATLVMLLSVAWLAAPKLRERWAAFLWLFALWDASYYGALWVTVRWPASLRDLDVLFLIPVPWVAQVWFPILVSVLSMLTVLLANKPE